MLRAIAPHLIASLVLAAIAGGLYGAGLVSAPALYLAMLLAGLPGSVAYLRWEERQHRQR
jgi:hypothetical protein